ncbi:MAG: hypothetical protein HY820_28240 [Acidobacteria bacterium]|nr:hypothetical protein [Acidobacteriota bacterium]
MDGIRNVTIIGFLKRTIRMDFVSQLSGSRQGVALDKALVEQALCKKIAPALRPGRGFAAGSRNPLLKLDRV